LQPEFITISDLEFQHTLRESEKPMLVEFTAEWSGASHINAPVLRAIARRFQDKMYFYRVNVEEHRELADAYGVHIIPTLLILQNGRTAGHMTGPVPRDLLLGKIEALLD